MSYSISNLAYKNVESKLYFFDANFWLFVFKPKFDLKPNQLKYLDFFSKFKESKASPKVVVPLLLLSEVINRYMRDVAMMKYANKNGSAITRDYYKQVYRNTPEYKEQLQLFCDEINSYNQYMNIVSDDFGKTFKLEDVITSKANLDFNDHFYIKLAKQHNLTIVTDDGDFFVEDVEVLTHNKSLIDKANEQLVKGKTKN